MRLMFFQDEVAGKTYSRINPDEPNGIYEINFIVFKRVGKEIYK